MRISHVFYGITAFWLLVGLLGLALDKPGHYGDNFVTEAVILAAIYSVGASLAHQNESRNP